MPRKALTISQKGGSPAWIGGRFAEGQAGWELGGVMKAADSQDPPRENAWSEMEGRELFLIPVPFHTCAPNYLSEANKVCCEAGAFCARSSTSARLAGSL